MRENDRDGNGEELELPEELASIVGKDPEVRRIIAKFTAIQARLTAPFTAIAEKVKPEHISQAIAYQEEAHRLAYKDRLTTKIISVVTLFGTFLFLGFVIWYLTKAGQPQLIERIIAFVIGLVAGFLGGFGAGRSIR